MNKRDQNSKREREIERHRARERRHRQGKVHVYGWVPGPSLPARAVNKGSNGSCGEALSRPGQGNG